MDPYVCIADKWIPCFTIACAETNLFSEKKKKQVLFPAPFSKCKSFRTIIIKSMCAFNAKETALASPSFCQLVLHVEKKRKKSFDKRVALIRAA